MAKNVIICGGGIMGASTAYQLALRGVKVTVVESNHVACGASGKAGGFLARSWCDGQHTEELAQVGFDMHKEWAGTEELGNCDYRAVTTLSVALASEATAASWSKRAHQKRGDSVAVPGWIDGKAYCKEIGTPADTAQVNPFKLTTALIAAAEKRGAVLVAGSVTEIVVDRSQQPHRVTGVRVGERVLACDAVVVAMGPWSHQAAAWLPIPEVDGIKAHSIVMRPPFEVTAHALFLSEEDGEADPEVYPRSNGEVYVCGMSEPVARPPPSSAVQPTTDACAALHKIAARVCSAFAALPLEKEQACFLPQSPDNRPLLGAVPHVAGAYVATGHGCWGILMAPSSGRAMAELIVDGAATSVALARFSLERFA